MKKEKLLPSQHLKMFLDFIDSAASEYTFCLESMKNEERLTQDLLHKLELDDLNYRERSKVATQLSLNRQKRRSFKDSVEELEPIVDFLNDPKNKSVLNALTQLLGEVRKVERYHSNRFYIPKVIPSEKVS